MNFAPKPGCTMCGLVSSALHGPLTSPRSAVARPTPSDEPEFLWQDGNFTVFREQRHPVSSLGHVIIAPNLHVPSLYRLSSSDVPLLLNLRDLATRHLHAISTTACSPCATPTMATQLQVTEKDPCFRIGFITPPFKDPKFPTDHLIAHAYIGPSPNLAGWWRGIAYGPLAWYDIDDLIAEIRESESNNRIKSGYENRGDAPIDAVPSAGARTGTADGLETTARGLGPVDADLECGEASPLPSTAIAGSVATIPAIRL